MTSLRQKILRAMNVVNNAEQTLSELQQLRYDIRRDQLMDKTHNCTEPGISTERLCEHEVVVSLTTYGQRLYSVSTAIESIMQGSVKPNRIVLWLDKGLEGTELPVALRRQQRRGLEIAYCKDIRSYTKLLPALRQYPEAAIITIDDDLIYNYDLVERLLGKHRECPRSIAACRIHRIVLDEAGRPLPYMRWDWTASPTDASPLNFLTGVGGVLYPPHAFDDEVFNEAVFLDICRYADDIWFYAMALKAGTSIVKCFTHNRYGNDYIVNYEVQDMGLLNINIGANGRNDEQLRAVLDRYDLWEKLRATRQ